MHGIEEIVTRGTVVGEVRPERAAVLREPAAGRRSTVTGPTVRSRPCAPADKINAALPPVLGVAGLTGEIGSNSWAVSGSRTASGKAILSNDPHLATSIPSVFAQVGLHCRTITATCPFDVSGFSLASVPGVVIGKNATIAWGLTTSYPDVQDLYLEEVQGDTVRDGATYVPLTVIDRADLGPRRGDPRTIRIRSSKHGPLLSDVDQQLQTGGGRAGRARAGTRTRSR